MIDDIDIIEKIKLCDPYVKDFEICVSNKNSTVEDIRKFFLFSCLVKLNTDYIYISKTRLLETADTIFHKGEHFPSPF